MHVKSLAITAALLALTVAAPLAHAQDAAAPPPAACVTDPPAAGAARVVTGSGKQQSAPFKLDGGAYRVDWTSDKPVESYSYIRLEAADEGNGISSQWLLNPSGATAGQTTGQTYIYRIKPGAYYVAPAVPGGWSVTLTPITP